MKHLSFIKNNIDVTCLITLGDVSELESNFFIRKIQGIRSRVDVKLFYFLNEGLPVTLNELIFIAIARGLGLVIRDEEGEVLVTYNLDESMNGLLTEDGLFLVTEDGQYLVTEG